MVWKGAAKFIAHELVESADLEAGAATTLLFSWPAAIGCSGLAFEKFRLAKRLKSAVLMKDCVCTVAQETFGWLRGKDKKEIRTRSLIVG